MNELKEYGPKVRPSGPRVTAHGVAEAVREYNARFGQSELALWQAASPL